MIILDRYSGEESQYALNQVLFNPNTEVQPMLFVQETSGGAAVTGPTGSITLNVDKYEDKIAVLRRELASFNIDNLGATYSQGVGHPTLVSQSIIRVNVAGYYEVHMDGSLAIGDNTGEMIANRHGGYVILAQHGVANFHKAYIKAYVQTSSNQNVIGFSASRVVYIDLDPGTSYRDLAVYVEPLVNVANPATNVSAPEVFTDNTGNKFRSVLRPNNVYTDGTIKGYSSVQLGANPDFHVSLKLIKAGAP